MKTKHPLMWALVPAIVGFISVFIAKIGWLHSLTVVTVCIGAGIIIWAIRRGFAQPLQQLFQSEVVKKTGLFFVITAVLLAAFVGGEEVIKEYLMDRLDVNETGARFLTILFPLLIGAFFFPYKPVFDVDPGLVLQGMGLISFVFFVVYIASRYEERQVSMQNEQAYATGRKTTPKEDPLTVALAEGKPIPRGKVFRLNSPFRSSITFHEEGFYIMRGKTWMEPPEPVEGSLGGIRRFFRDADKTASEKGGRVPCYYNEAGGNLQYILEPEGSVEIMTRAAGSGPC